MEKIWKTDDYVDDNVVANVTRMQVMQINYKWKECYVILCEHYLV